MDAPIDGESRVRVPVLRASIDALSWSEAEQRVIGWADKRLSKVVCICNAHSAVSAVQNPAFLRAIEQCDLATPDGAPVAWMIGRVRGVAQPRISGPDLMLRVLAATEGRSLSVFLYGSKQSTLDQLVRMIGERFPRAKIAGTYSPPFRPLSPQEDEEVISRINGSGASIVFVGLGCPKQEIWMIERRGRVGAVMLGVGAAFDFHAGVIKRAPHWMQAHGLEWLHRLWSEPRRLWKRYLITNTLFIVYAMRQLMSRRAEKG